MGKGGRKVWGKKGRNLPPPRTLPSFLPPNKIMVKRRKGRACLIAQSMYKPTGILFSNLNFLSGHPLSSSPLHPHRQFRGMEDPEEEDIRLSWL